MKQLEEQRAVLVKKMKTYNETLTKVTKSVQSLETGYGSISTGESSGTGNNGSGSQSQLMQAAQQMQETQMSFNLQYLQLQNSMQNANRQFTMVSNIMKTKHDTVKNTISNMH